MHGSGGSWLDPYGLTSPSTRGTPVTKTIRLGDVPRTHLFSIACFQSHCSIICLTKMKLSLGFPCGPVVKVLHLHCMGHQFNQATKIPCAVLCGQKKKKRRDITSCCCCLVDKLCPAVCKAMDHSPPGSSLHGISQAKILKWVAISFSRGSSQPRD